MNGRWEPERVQYATSVSGLVGEIGLTVSIRHRCRHHRRRQRQHSETANTALIVVSVSFSRDSETSR